MGMTRQVSLEAKCCVFTMGYHNCHEMHTVSASLEHAW